MEYEVELTLFIVVAIVLAAFFFLLFFFKPIRNFLRRNFTIRTYYKTVRRSALENDFYLINKFVMNSEESNNVHIDHILFGDKFIYVIKDKYYKGALAASLENQSWVWFHSRKNKEYIDNPMLKNSIRCDRLSLISGLDRSYFISVVLVNDDVFLTPIESSDESSVILPLSKFCKYIEMNERNKNVSKLAAHDLSIAVKDIAELNQNGKK